MSIQEDCADVCRVCGEALFDGLCRYCHAKKVKKDYYESNKEIILSQQRSYKNNIKRKLIKRALDAESSIADSMGYDKLANFIREYRTKQLRGDE